MKQDVSLWTILCPTLPEFINNVEDKIPKGQFLTDAYTSLNFIDQTKFTLKAISRMFTLLKGCEITDFAGI